MTIRVSCTDSLPCVCTCMVLFCWLACLLARGRPSSSPSSTLASGRTTTLGSFSTWPTTSELYHAGLALAARPHSLGLECAGQCYLDWGLLTQYACDAQPTYASAARLRRASFFLAAGCTPQMGIGSLLIS